MTEELSIPVAGDWASFVLAHGSRAYAHELACVVGQDIAALERLRITGACRRRSKGLRFAELFSLWHGRAPEEADWPAPRKLPARKTYEWQAPEIAVLASLVGQLSVPDIARTLTNRLRERTADSEAVRTPIAVQVRINLIGLQTTDVVVGLTVSAAGREIGSVTIVRRAIQKKQLRALRVGRLWVIPRPAWEVWNTKRTAPPRGYVLLRAIREGLGIRSDKLSEFCRMGYVPTAIRRQPFGEKGPSTPYGIWYIKKKIADKLLADRAAGRPMPWHGKPLLDNLRVTFRLWKSRKHPAYCRTCADIWGEAGVPESFEQYVKVYPPLAHGAKRHLTHKLDPGMGIRAVAAYVRRPLSDVRSAIRHGMLEATVRGKRHFISRTEATRWKARHCPTGDGARSWISLPTAEKLYLFTLPELRNFIARGKLVSKIGIDGAMRGILYVSKHQCRRLREDMGFTEQDAADRVGVSVSRLRALLKDVNWRKAHQIPLATVQAAIKRLRSHQGYTVEEAAKKLGVPTQWVIDRKQDGTFKVSSVKWNRQRLYISEPMLNRLREAKLNPSVREQFDESWLRMSDAALEAGVTGATIIKWTEQGTLARRRSRLGWRYHRDAVRARARSYWRTVRFRRATPPTWILSEARA